MPTAPSRKARGEKKRRAGRDSENPQAGGTGHRRYPPLLIMLFLFLEGDDMELVITLGLILVLSL
jgi:hypothetical protein